MQVTQVQSLGQEDPLEEEVTTHSSGEFLGQKSLAGYVQPMGSTQLNNEHFHFQKT